MKLKSLALIISLSSSILYSQWPPANINNSAYTTGYYATDSDLLVGQCTWFVYGRIQETGLIPKTVLESNSIFWGNAENWDNLARNSGIATGYNQVPGSIAVYEKRHVAFVDAIDRFTESNAIPRKGENVVIAANKTRLRENYSVNSSIIYEMPMFTIMSIDTGAVFNEGFAWYKMSGNGFSGWAAWLTIDGSGPAITDFKNVSGYWWNFTRIRLEPTFPFAGNKPDVYIYPNAQPLSPNNGESNCSSKITLKWSSVKGASYWLQVSKNSSYTDLVYNQKNISSTSFQVELQPDTKYWWRVHIGTPVYTTQWEGWNFTTSSNISQPNIILSTNSMSFNNQLVNTTSSIKSYTVSASNLVSNLIINAPSGFQLLSDGSSGFSNQIQLSPSGGSIINKTIHVIFNPTSASAYSGKLVHNSNGAVTKEISISGTGINQIKIDDISLSKNNLFPYEQFLINYTINSSYTKSVILGASIGFSSNNNWFLSDPGNDKKVSLSIGTNKVSRTFNLLNTISTGIYDLIVALWSDENNNGKIDPSIDYLLNSRIILNSISINQSPSLVQVTINSIPPGLTFNLDNGQNYQTPYTFSFVKNSSHAIVWNSLQNGVDGTRYSFNKWQDSFSSNLRTIFVNEKTAFTALFNTQYYLNMFPNNNGIITPISGWFNKGDIINIKAVPNTGYKFISWIGNGSGSYSGPSSFSSVTMNNPISQTAVFENSSGSIAVINPAPSVNWVVGNQVNINWIASNNINSVNVKLSKNGGVTFPIILASGVNANSSFYLLVPNYPGTQNQIKIESKNDPNVFGLSGIFTIQAPVVQNPPSAVTDQPTNITTSSAQLNGTVNANGLNTTYYFQYGETTNFGSTTNVKNLQSVSNSSTVNEVITNLNQGKTYYYRIIATNSSGTTFGTPISFSTSQATANQKPIVFTRNATNYNYNSALLNASINPNGKSTSYYFVYGKTTSYGNQTTSKNAGSSNSFSDFSEQITGLDANTVYHFKVIAANSEGSSEGVDFSFTTESILSSQKPIVNTTISGNITSTSAQVKGVVNPNGYNTTYYFEFGKTLSYGNKSAEQMTGIGTSNINVAADLSGLSSESVYNYRLVAQNAAGISYGQNMTFKTASTTSVPILVYEEPSGIEDKTAQLNAKVNPNGFPTTAHFEWGTTTGYGNSTNPYAIGYGTSEVHYQAYLNKILSPGTTYHYRAVAVNSIGTTYSSDYTFKTLSAPLQQPTLNTLQPTNITDNSAEFHGTIHPHEVKVTYSFIYGYSPSGTGKQATWIDIPAGNQVVNVSQKITGLIPNTSYTYQIYAQSRGGNSWGNQVTFKTLTSNVPAPQVYTLDASQIRLTEAYLNAAINPNGSATTYYFDYGPTQSYGFKTQTDMTGNQTSPTNVSSVIQGLTANTLYHYRIVASNAGGSVIGADKTFTTAITINNPPSASTVAASNILSNKAQLNGKINPNGRITNYYFEYGLTLSLGNFTSTRSLSSGNNIVDLNEIVDGLMPNTKYYFRIIAENQGGKTEGSIFNFSTATQQFNVNLAVNLPQAGAANGSGSFNVGQNVNILAVPNNQYIFDNWTENENVLSINDSHDLTIDRDRNIVANFKLIGAPVLQISQSSFTADFQSGQLSINISNSGTGEMIWYATTSYDWIVLTNAKGVNSGNINIEYSENSGPYREGKIIIVSEGASNSPLEILIKQGPYQSYNLSTSSFPLNAGITSGNGAYSANSLVNVNAISNENYVFKNWQENNNVLSTDPEFSFNLTRDLNLVAHFNPLPRSTFTVLATANPPEAGSVTGSGNYSNGSMVSISAIPNSCWDFLAWIENQNLISTANSFTFPISNDRNLIALFQILTDKKEEIFITDYKLYQNFPNPFNPVTTIRFQIPVFGLVSIKIYDSLGRELVTLIDQEKSPGSYQVYFNGIDYSSGVYFCVMRTNENVVVKKMLLLK